MAVPLFIPGAIKRKVYKTRQTLERLSDSEIREHCGVPAWGARELIDLFDPIEGQLSTAVPVDTKVLVFLSQLRSGSFQRIVGGVCGVSRSTVSRIIEECANYTLNSFARTAINFPITASGLNKLKQDYYEVSRIPNTIGVVDGTHVPIIAPSVHEPVYVNRKQYHSINCQVVTSRDYQILDVVAKWPGSTHDSFIWRNSSVKDRLYSGEFGTSHFLGNFSVEWP